MKTLIVVVVVIVLLLIAAALSARMALCQFWNANVDGRLGAVQRSSTRSLFAGPQSRSVFPQPGHDQAGVSWRGPRMRSGVRRRSRFRPAAGAEPGTSSAGWWRRSGATTGRRAS